MHIVLANGHPHDDRRGLVLLADSSACPANDPASNEAGNFLLGQLPGQGAANLYYWYYGTLAMFQLQGDYWQQWNEALRRQLLASSGRGPVGWHLGPRRRLGRLRRTDL